MRKSNKRETDGCGNTYELVAEIDSTWQCDISSKFKELFNRTYCYLDGEMAAVSSSHMLSGDVIHYFYGGGGRFLTKYIVKVRDSKRPVKTEFWKLVGKGKGMLESAWEEIRRDELLERLKKELPLEDLEKLVREKLDIV
jgi:hypothetical protein